MQVTPQPRSQPPSSHTGKDIVERIGRVPFLKQLSCQSTLPLYHMYIVKGVQENCISLFLELPGLCNCVIKTRPHQHDVQTLTSMVPYTVDFEFRCGGRHEDSALDLHGPAAVGDSLGMVTCTCSHNSTRSFLLTQVTECSGCPSYLETSNSLQVLPLEIHIGLVLFGQVGRLLEFGVGHDFLVLAVGLVYLGCGHQLGWGFGLLHLKLQTQQKDLNYISPSHKNQSCQSPILLLIALANEWVVTTFLRLITDPASDILALVLVFQFAPKRGVFSQNLGILLGESSSFSLHLSCLFTIATETGYFSWILTLNSLSYFSIQSVDVISYPITLATSTYRLAQKSASSKQEK